MTMRSRTRIALAIALLPAIISCGAPQPDGLDEVGDASESDTNTTDTSESETGDDGQAECIAGDMLTVDALLLAPSAEQARLFGPQGELSLPVSGPDGTLVSLAGAADATRVFVARSALSVNQARVHAFTRASGELEWAVDLDGYVGQLFAGDDGSVVATVGGGLGVRIADGQLQSLDREPIGGVHEGWIPVRELDSEGLVTEIGWLATADLGYVAAALQPGPSQAVHVEGSTFEFIASNDGAASLVQVDPSESSSIPLSSLADLPVENVTATASSGPLRLVEGRELETEQTRFVRLDVELGEQVDIDPVPPDGYEFFDCYFRRPALDRSGAVLFELRNASAAQLFAYTLELDSWTPVGKPIGLVEDLAVDRSFGSTHVLSSAAQLNTFCPPTEWDELPDGALSGATVQVVRIDPPLTLELPVANGWSVAVDEGERCVAYEGEAGWTVQGLDQVGSLALGPGQWLWLD